MRAGESREDVGSGGGDWGYKHGEEGTTVHA